MRDTGMWGVGVWALLVGGVLVFGWSAVANLSGASFAPAPSSTARSAARPPAAPYPADSLARATVARDPFRADRRPAPVAYDPIRGTASPPDAPPKPALVLSGIVWGSTPQAVIEGLPGIEGPRVMRVGDVVASLKVKRIESSRVVIVGMDTTWTLTVREPWR